MSQSSSATTVLTAPESILKGGLRSVLSSLDVQLEDELARYRRQRRLQAKAAQAQSAQQKVSSKAAPALSLAAGQAGEASAKGGGQPAVAEALCDGQNPAAAEVSSLALLPRGDDADANLDDDYFASSAALLESLSALPEPELDGIKLDQPSGDRLLKKLLTPAGLGAALLTLVGGATAGYLLLNPDSLGHLRWAVGPSPEAETSEGETIAPESAARTAPVTPRAIAPDLPPGAPDLTQREFVQLSLSTLGTIDPEGNPIRSHRSLGLGDLTSLGSVGSITAAQAQLLPGRFGQGNTAGSGQLPNVVQPLSQGSLLSGLSNAVSGRSTAEQMTSATPLPSVISVGGQAPAAPVIQPMEVKQLPTPARAAAPAPKPAAPKPAAAKPAAPAPAPAEAPIAYWEPAPAAPVEAIAPAESSRRASYIVVAPYISDAMLAQVQTVVPDAYVENFDSGAKIQAGVFDDAASAGDLLRLLQEQGVTATVENR